MVKWDNLKMKISHIKPMLFGYRYWLMASAFVLLSMGILENFFHRQLVVTYDVNHTLKLFTKEIAYHHLTPTQLKIVSKRFTATLEATLKNYAKVHHAVILKTSFVVASDKDITFEIEKELSQNMKEKP